MFYEGVDRYWANGCLSRPMRRRVKRWVEAERERERERERKRREEKRREEKRREEKRSRGCP